MDYFKDYKIADLDCEFYKYLYEFENQIKQRTGKQIILIDYDKK